VRRASLVVSLVVVLTYFALAAVPYWSYWHTGGTMMAGKGGDPATDAWFLAWVPYALAHGHNPLVTDWGNYPVGVNGITGIGMPLLGVLGAPVTALWNSFVTTTLLFTLAFPLSAVGGYVFVRQWVAWWPAAFVGGLLYGFSPYLVEHGSSHLNLVFVPLPPLILLMLSKILDRVEHPLRWGLALGALCVAQFLISPEVLASTAVVGAAGLCVAAVAGAGSWPWSRSSSAVRERWRPVLGGLGVAGLVAAVCLAYPLWLLVAGPGHVTGAVQDTSLYRGNLLGPVIPGSDMYFHTAASARLADTFSGASENGLYLGVPLLIILLAGAAGLWRRRPAMRIVAVVTAAAFVLSLGSRLVVGHHVVASVPLPEAIFNRIPLLESTISARYSLYVVLGAAVMLAMIIDAVHEWLRVLPSAGGPPVTRVPAARVPAARVPAARVPAVRVPAVRVPAVRVPAVRVLPVVVPAAIAIVALAPLLPAWPYWLNVTQVPRYFSASSASASGLARIPEASVAVTYPFPLLRDAHPMLWQIAAGMRYKSPGGRFVAPLPPPVGDNVEGVFSYLSAGHQVARTPALRATLTGELRGWHVRTVLVQAAGNRRAAVLAFFGWLLGRPPDQTVGDISAWYSLPAR
jgi:hypothetical protein